MILSRNEKNNVYPCKPQFYYIKVGFKGVEIIQACFRDENTFCLWFTIIPPVKVDLNVNDCDLQNTLLPLVNIHS